MTASLTPGRPVSIAAEPPAQNVRNALQTLAAIQPDPEGNLVLRPEDVAGIRTRLTVAVLQLEGKA